MGTDHVGGPKGSKVCGTQEVYCGSISDYPICQPPDSQDGWVGVERLMMQDIVGGDPKPILLNKEATPPVGATMRNPYFFNDPTTETIDEREIMQMIMGKFLEKNKFMGFCRSEYLGEGAESYRWYVYKDRVGMGGYLALYNDVPRRILSPLMIDDAGIKLYPDEVIALKKCPEIDLRDNDIFVIKSPKEDGEDARGNILYTQGLYMFTMSARRLRNDDETGILDVLDSDTKIPGLSEDTRDRLASQLGDAYEDATAQKAFLRESSWHQKINIMMMALFIYVAGQPYWKKLWKRFIVGGVNKTDLRKEMENKIAANKDYHVKGLSEQARDGWLEADDPDFKHVLIEGKTGSGKDMLADEMINLLVRNDPSAPKGFDNAPIYRISPSEFKADTMYRGTVADKVVELVRMAKKGKVILVISEFDRVVLGGGTTNDKGEQVSELLLNDLEDEVIRKNLIILATTARGEELRIGADNLIRRMNWVLKEVDPLSEVIKNMDGHKTNVTYATHYGVEFSKEAIDSAARLGETEYRPSTIKVDPKTGAKSIPVPRYYAAEKVLKGAAKIARDTAPEGVTKPVVTVEHTIQATEKLTKKSLDRHAVADLISADPNSLMLFDLPGTETGAMEANEMDAMQKRAMELERGLKFLGIMEHPDPVIRHIVAEMKADATIPKMMECDYLAYAEQMKYVMEDPSSAGAYMEGRSGGKFKSGELFQLFERTKKGLETSGMISVKADAVRSKGESGKGKGGAKEAAKKAGK